VIFAPTQFSERLPRKRSDRSMRSSVHFVSAAASLRLLTLVGCFLLIGTAIASAQSDRLFDKQGANVSGTVVESSKDAVQLKKGNSNQSFASTDILKIMFQGDPSSLTKAREFALDEQYDQALVELKNVNAGDIDRDVIKADYAFYTVLAQGELALAGKGDKKAAVANALKFASTYSSSWHIYDTAKLLGDLALALNDHANALKYYSLLARAPSADTKIEAVYLTGWVHLKKGDADTASKEFDKVISLQPQTPTAVRLQTLSKAGKSVALALGGKGAEGLAMVQGLIADLNPTDTELAAQIYNAQGASYEAGGDNEGAIMAYLHTHLMFATQPDAHAEALKRLAELWPQVGKPERAAEARQELQQRYPGF
jgi:tetratricopeptide (TPR) repeat protein